MLKLRKYKTGSVIIIAGLLLITSGVVFGLKAQAAEPQSQADCPAGTTFVPGPINSAVGGSTGNTNNPSPRRPNTCVNTSTPPRPTTSITCPDGRKVDGVTPGLSADDLKIVCAGGTSEPPASVKSDCKGPDIKAGIKDPKDPNHCGILNYLVLFIQFLTGIVGVAVVASIIIGGIQYSMSSDDPSAVTAAKKRILNAIVALGIYAFMFAFLQYLIPGGIL